jgi:hypothetical protein
MAALMQEQKNIQREIEKPDSAGKQNAVLQRNIVLSAYRIILWCSNI